MKKFVNGVFKLPMGQYLEVPAFSQSMLKLVAKSPAHFRYAIEHTEPSSPEQIMGAVMHSAVLEPHLLDDSCWVRPETYVHPKKGDTRKWNGNATECKDWLAAHNDREVIRQNDFDAVMGMHHAVFDHPTAAAALKEGSAENCFFVEDPVTGLPLKCRTDWLSGNTIVDLKSCLDASEAAFAKTIADYGYDVQAAFNLDMTKWLDVPKDYFIFIAVEKEPPFAVAVYELDQESIEIGRNKYRRWLSLVDHCNKTSEWPGYDPAIKRISLPDWHKRRQLLSLDYNSDWRMPTLLPDAESGTPNNSPAALVGSP